MSQTSATRVTGDVLLVGSVPLSSVEEVFATSAEVLGSDVSSLPDGEIGDRETWVGFVPIHTLSRHPDLDEQNRPTEGLQQPAHDDSPEARPAADEGQLWTFEIKPGVTDFRFDDLGYADLSIESYAIFTRLREEGRIPDGVRFQVGLPGPISAIAPFFRNPSQWQTALQAYVDAIHREIDRILEVVPADDLVVQFDFAWEVNDLSIGDATYYPFWPESTYDEKFARHTEWAVAIVDDVPDDVVVGIHWCYGTWGGWPMTAMDDLEICVQLSNAVVRRANRRIDYIHMPVIRHPEEAFFAPLDGLEIGDTRVYLGLVHHTDGVAGFNERVELARRHLPEFGIASVCGYGRLTSSEVGPALEAHAECARALRA